MRLPMPGSASASWATYRARFAAVFAGADLRVCAAFWLFGLINNVLYVIILSSALDLVGPLVPKSLVLLFDVLPSFFTKLIAPYFIHRIPYAVRIWFFVAVSAGGMLLIALTPTSKDAGTVSLKMVGVMLASLSSGGGELSFLGLTHYYGQFSLAAWGSGTGGAGLVGAGAYVVATTWIGMSVRTSLLAFSFLPLIMLFSFFILLPREVLMDGRMNQSYEVIAGQEEEDDRLTSHEEAATGGYLGDAEHGNISSSITRLNPSSSRVHTEPAPSSLLANLRRARSLFIPYMLPLLLVYVAEYTINQGVSPTLLFPISESPFAEYRSFYPTYNAIYQLGVFISRSSTPFFRIHNLYLPSLLQVVNLGFLVAQSMFYFLPNVWFVFLVVFWEGLLGGLVYVNTFAEITDRVPLADREFSLGATSVSDSGGICIAGFLGMAVEVALCQWNVDRGRKWCRTL